VERDRGSRRRLARSQTASHETPKRAATARFARPVAIARSFWGRAGDRKSCSGVQRSASPDIFCFFVSPGYTAIKIYHDNASSIAIMRRNPNSGRQPASTLSGEDDVLKYRIYLRACYFAYNAL
jgi:hypothetical protein